MTTAEPSFHDLMTSAEVADYLRLPLPTVYYLAKTGKLPCFQVGKRWRFWRDEIERLRNTSNSPPAVLVVDDDPLMRQILHHGLTRAGCEVSVAAGIDEALELTRRTDFAALLIDLVLGSERGVDLIYRLLGAYSLRQMLIITGHPDLVETARCWNWARLPCC